MKINRWLLLSTLTLLLTWSPAYSQCREQTRTTGTCGFCAATTVPVSSVNSSVSELMGVARQLFRAGRYQEAHAILKVVQTLDPKNHSARACLVLCERRLSTVCGDAVECADGDDCIQPPAAACGNSTGVCAACEVMENCWQCVGGPCEFAIRCVTAGVKHGQSGCRTAQCCPASECCATATCKECKRTCSEKNCCTVPCACKTTGACCHSECACCGQSKCCCAAAKCCGTSGTQCCCTPVSTAKCGCASAGACCCKGNCGCGDNCHCASGARKLVSLRYMGKCPALAAYKGHCPVLAGRMAAPAPQHHQPTVIVIIQQAPAAPVLTGIPHYYHGGEMPHATFIPAPVPPAPFVIHGQSFAPPIPPLPVPPGNWVRQPQPFNVVVPTSRSILRTTEPGDIHEDRPGTILQPQD